MEPPESSQAEGLWPQPSSSDPGSSARRRQAPGENPAARLKARLKRSLGLVAHVAGDRPDLRRPLAQHPRRDLHPPAGEVVHRRVAHQLREAERQCRSGRPHRPGQPVQRPRSRGIGVNECQRPPDHWIAEAQQPPGVVHRSRLHAPAHHLHEHQLAQAEQHGPTTRARPPRLGDGEVHQGREPVLRPPGLTTHAHHRRQPRHQRIEWIHVASEEAADDVCLRRTASTGGHDRRELPCGHPPQEAQRRLAWLAGPERRCAGHEVGMAVRHEQHISRLELHRWAIHQPTPGMTAGDHVVGDDVPSPRQDQRCELLRPRRLQDERLRAVDQEEQCPGHPDRAQDVGEGVRPGRPVSGHEVPILTGRASKRTGRSAMASLHPSGHPRR